jgi:hypothetical protein
VNEIVVALPKATAAPVLSVTLGVLAPTASAPVKVSAWSPV